MDALFFFNATTHQQSRSQFSTILTQIKMSYFIYMLNIQIDTKKLELVIHFQFNNIKLSLFVSHIQRS